MIASPSTRVDSARPPRSTAGSQAMSSLAGLGVFCSAYLAAFGSALFFVLHAFGGQPGPWQALICAAPALLAVALCFTDRSDRRQYSARLAVCVLMPPILQLMWGSSEPVLMSDLTGWLVWGGAALVHAIGFCTTVWWLAQKTTGIAAVAGVPPVGAAALGRRLQSLEAAGLPVNVGPGRQPAQWVVALRYPSGVDRSHRIGLALDEATATVTVHEQLGARGTAPQDGEEASLRTLADPAFDPSRPDAQEVWNHAIQATMIEPERLAALAPGLEGDRVVVLPGQAAALDGEGVVTLLAALVTASGYAWQAELGRVPG